MIEQGEERRRQILAFIREYMGRVGWAPTIAEIADGVGLVSPNSTRNHVARLAEEGYLVVGPRRSRAISLVDPAPDGWTREKGPVTPQAARDSRPGRPRVKVNDQA